MTSVRQLLTPRRVLALACAVAIFLAAAWLLLGAASGFALSIVAIGVAVLLERWIAGTIAGRALHARLARRHPVADKRIAAWGLTGVLAVRALGTPTPVIGWASSATGLRAWQVAVGCMVGTMPRAVAYDTLGASGASLLRPAEWG